MIDTLLALIGLGQSQSHWSSARYSNASSHLANIESICLETGVQLNYEIQRLAELAGKVGVPADQAVGLLVQMADQNERLSDLAATNRELLSNKGANVQMVTELERWEGTCKVIPKQIDLTVRQIERVLRKV